MSKPLHLLVVEESEAEVAPLVRELRRHGYEPEAVHVDAADALRDALQRQAWDVVIADHALSGFSSQDALRVLQASGLDLPFIIVSETLGEAVAVAAMKAGAHDYVMKDHLTRLGLAVERELQEASVRRQRREAEQLLAAQQAVTCILAEADTLGEAGAKILQALAKTGEWEAGEIWTVDRPSDVLRCLEIWHTATKPLGEFETRTRAMTFARGVGLPGRVWASGQPAWIADVTQDANFPRAPLAAEAGLRGAIGFPIGLPMVVGHEVIGVITFFRTAPGQPDEKLLAVFNAIGSQIGQFLVRQRAEEELKKLSSAVQQTANCVLIADRNGVIEYVNPAFERTTGYAREDVIGKTPRLLKSGQHDQKLYETLWNTVLAGGTFFAEFVNRKKSGELYHTEQTITPIRDSHGHITHFVSNGHDITERKQMEDERKRLMDVLEASLNEIYIFDAQTLRFEYVNACAQRNLGYAMDALRTFTPLAIKPELSEAAFHELIGPLRRHEKEKIVFQTVHRRADGSRYPVEVDLQLVQDGGKPVFLAVINDITERKLAEAALRASEASNRAILESALDCIVAINHEGKIIEFNPAAERTFGYTRAEALGQDMAELIIPPALHERHRRGMAHYLATGEGPVMGKRLEMTAIRKGAVEFPIELTIARIAGTEPLMFTGFMRDITERKQAERQSAGELRVLELLARAAPHAECLDRLARECEALFPGMICSVLLLDADGRHLRHGAAPSLPADYIAAIDGIEIGPGVGSCGTAAHTGRTVIVSDIATDPLWAEYKELALRHGLRACWSVPILGEAGRVLGTLALYYQSPRAPQPEELAAHERSANLASLAILRQRTLEALRASEARYRTLAESAQDIIYVINREFRMEYINEYGAKQFGRPVQEMAGRHLTELFPPETTQWQLADLAGIFRTGEPLHRERPLPVGQESVWLDTRLVPIKNATGEVESILGISRDITERKRTEEALQKSHEHYRRVIEDIFKFVPEALLVFTRNLDLFKENQAFEDLVRTYAPKLHYTEPELRGLLLQEIRAKVLSGDAGAIRIPPKNRDGQGTRGPDHSGEGVEPPAPPIPGFS